MQVESYYISRFLDFYVSDNFIVLLLTGQCVSLFSFFTVYFERKTRKTIHVNSLPRRFLEPIMTKLWKCRYRETEKPRNVVALNVHLPTKPSGVFKMYHKFGLCSEIFSSRHIDNNVCKMRSLLSYENFIFKSRHVKVSFVHCFETFMLNTIFLQRTYYFIYEAFKLPLCKQEPVKGKLNVKLLQITFTAKLFDVL